MEEKPGGRCVSAGMCVFVSYLAALFTSFTSTDVLGEKLFFKSAFEESQMLQDETPTCVCVCACMPVSELRLT